ncbi:MAG: tripartite tricarboxylate transporter TctB family protein [Sedimentibacter sp.]|uniref:tripartite tricarboxylate transporter TctB family protein n=1 Tax=Sedimentibacter sp. TaxID=1960295 RepID=UPI003158D1F1
MKNKNIHQDVYISIVIYSALIFMYTVAAKLPKDSSIFPKMLIVLFAVLNTAVFIKAVKKTRIMMSENNKEVNTITWKTIKTPLTVFLISVIYVIILKISNYFIATAIFMIVLMKFYKLKSWKTILLTTIIYNIIIYVGFVKMLNVPLI